ncbi:MAG: hypothetical protein ACREFX_00100 [Opitutaceae bacterium]
MNSATLEAALAALDLGLIHRCSIPGPRHTSYPPATKFREKVDRKALRRAIVEDNGPGAGPLSLYFHLPFWQSLCWYCAGAGASPNRHSRTV